LKAEERKGMSKETWFRILKRLGILLGAVIAAVGTLLGYWYIRPNRALVAESLAMESWDAVKDGAHNSNTDMIYWRDRFYLIHASSPWHFASEKCRLMVWWSENARDWEKVAELWTPGEDIRDPKFAAIGDRLFVYALKNAIFTAEPYSTVFSVSEDGQNWAPFQAIDLDGWLFWRPKTVDGHTWYVPAYWHEHGRSVLLKSTDGERWTQVSQIYEGERNDETAIEFLPDGRIICTGRLEVSDNWLGDNRGSTMIGVVSPPFDQWSVTKSRVTRLDGPYLFSHGGSVYAAGRYQPGRRGFFTGLGSIFSRKRTSLFLVKESGLTYLSDLPSAGDTSYTGVVIRGDDLYVSYYTSDIDRDFPWIMGMLAPSDIRVARIALPSLEALARNRDQ
jgi:hypothetical protein